MSFKPEWTLYRQGKDAERILIGEQSPERVKNQEGHVDYLPFRSVMEIVRRIQENFKQPYDPAQPSLRYPLAYWLHRYLSEALAARGGAVKFFTAVNSILDLRHGVDGFIDYQTPEGLLVTVPLDLTLNESKFAGGTHGHFIVPATEAMMESSEVVREQSKAISKDLLMKLADQEKELTARMRPSYQPYQPTRHLRRRPAQAA
ncbi:MAG: hypothetical protein NTV81_00785 [Candidatus Komeilibacteria bacterium]|nr:hypothetical protein [Candidatus Komeilibacteria bacterium]